jgi:hypothetical protein
MNFHDLPVDDYEAIYALIFFVPSVRLPIQLALRRTLVRLSRCAANAGFGNPGEHFRM